VFGAFCNVDGNVGVVVVEVGKVQVELRCTSGV